MNKQTEKPLLLTDVLPAFADELHQLLIEKGEPELAAYVLVCRPEELLTIREALAPHEAVRPELWAVLLDRKADAGKRVRAAGALAGLTPDDPRLRRYDEPFPLD